MLLSFNNFTAISNYQICRITQNLNERRPMSKTTSKLMRSSLLLRETERCPVVTSMHTCRGSTKASNTSCLETEQISFSSTLFSTFTECWRLSRKLPRCIHAGTSRIVLLSLNSLVSASHLWLGNNLSHSSVACQRFYVKLEKISSRQI